MRQLNKNSPKKEKVRAEARTTPRELERRHKEPEDSAGKKRDGEVTAPEPEGREKAGGDKKRGPGSATAHGIVNRIQEKPM